MNSTTLKELLTVAAPLAGVAWNYFQSAKKSDLRELRRRVTTLERAFGDLYSLVTEFLDEIDLLVDGLPHGLRAPFRTHIVIFRTAMQRQRDRIHNAESEQEDAAPPST